MSTVAITPATNHETHPFVSVVIPTHNRAVLLARLLGSLLTQDYPAHAMEIIVVHNVGSDDTENTVREITSTGSIAIHYFAKNNRGPMPSRNFGITVAKGSIVAFIDDDCIATPQWLSDGVRGMAPGIGIVQGRTLPCPDQPRKLLEKTIEIPQATPFFETCNIFYRKEALQAAGGFSAEFAKQKIFYGEDTDLAWKVKEHGFGTAFAPEALVYHEVFNATFKEWLLEPRRMYIWPYLVKKHPKLREHMFLRYFLTERGAFFDLAIAGIAVAGFVHPVALVLTIPYIVFRLHEPARTRNPVLRIVKLFAGIPRAAVFFVALLVGSVRFRSLLL